MGRAYRAHAPAWDSFCPMQAEGGFVAATGNWVTVGIDNGGTANNGTVRDRTAGSW